MSRLRTIVDDIGDFLRNNQNSSYTLKFLSSKFNVAPEILERWLIILEERKIVEIVYKGLEVNVKYIYKENPKQKVYSIDEEDERIDVKIWKIKEKFLYKARNRGFSNKNELKEMWVNYLEANHISEIRNKFFKKAKLKGLPWEVANNAWKQYYSKLIEIN